MSTLDRTAPLVEANLTLFARDPGPLLGRIIQPVLSLLILQRLYVVALGSRAEGTTQVVLGYLVLFSLLGTSIVGNAILTDRKWNTFDRLRSCPLYPAELLIGKAIPILLFILVQQAVLFTLGVAVLGLQVNSYSLLAIADVVWAISVLCLGIAIAVLVNSFAQLSAIIDIGASICTGLGGGLVPLGVMPAWVRQLAPLSPAFWGMRGLEGALSGQPTTTLTSSAVLAAMAAICIVIAGYRLRRGWGRGTLL
jgi:ABC-2 type transport system permease protein